MQQVIFEFSWYTPADVFKFPVNINFTVFYLLVDYGSIQM